MNVNYIVSFKRHTQVMFDIEIDTDGVSYDEMLNQIQLQAFMCLCQNGLDTQDVWKISTAANWTDTWCKENGPLPSDFKESFNGKFYYDEDFTLYDMFSEIFVNMQLRSLPLVGNAYSVEEYYNKIA
ncbi:hypothetical protein [Ruegeria atlantica]|uniref:hypothetical protein n=1 Tax=Ruegeria atlantica TaxID=81569 RepID=UPI001480A764|nr:hypothetical protein [Ruegeria atlantica]